MNARCLLSGLGLMVFLSGGASAQTDGLFLDRWHVYRQGIVGLYGPDGNFNPGRYTWSILTPSPTHIPGLPAYVDPSGMHPFPEVPVDSETGNSSTLIFRDCYHSDRCEFSFPQMELPTSKRLVIRLTGIHTPQLNASCEQETFLGKQARNLIHEHLSSAVHIELKNFSNRGKEMTGRLVADGQDLSELLVDQGLAVRFNDKKKDWCS